MQTKTVTYEGQGHTLKAIVGEATSFRGMQRSILVSQAIADIRDEKDSKGDAKLPDNVEVMARFFLRRYIYPTCRACLLEAEGFSMDLSFEEFGELPDAFVAKWEKAALELNPHWELQAREDEKAEEKKKEPSEST